MHLVGNVLGHNPTKLQIYPTSNYGVRPLGHNPSTRLMPRLFLDKSHNMDLKKNPFVKIFHEIPRKNKVFTKIFLRENFRGNFLFFFSWKLFRENFCANFFTKIIFAKIWRKIFREKYLFEILAKKFAQMFSRKICPEKKIRKFPWKFSRKKVHHYIRENLRKNFAQNFSAIKFATIFFAIINNYNFMPI